MVAAIDTVLDMTQNGAPPVRMRYSFDHLVKPSEDGEELQCVFYITLDGVAHYVKLIDSKLVLKTMEFNKPGSEDLSRLELLKTYAQETFTIMSTDIVDVTDVTELTGEVMGHLTGLNRYVRDTRPDLDVRTINATGLFATAYPSTEELITGIDILEKRIEQAEK